VIDKRGSSYYGKIDLNSDSVVETASCGATGAASVATVVGGLGAGFDPNGDYGIYPKPKKKPIVIRR
jgi:hypothetical protein